MANSLDYTVDMMYEESEPESTPIKDYFRGKTVLLTGGTGFLGLLYVEKLLRVGVRSLYLVIRNKKGKSPEERVQELYSGRLFNRVAKLDANYLQRIKLVEGDMNQEQFGISNEDLVDIYKNVQMVIHAAADVRFDQALPNLILTNVRGTKEILRISENIENLEVFAYISTAYSHAPRYNIDEKFYEPAIDPNVIIHIVENQGESDDFIILQDRISHPWPNNYVYSKSLSEELVRRWKWHIPVCVIRPTIVISTHEDPLPGWGGNLYGLNGVSISVGSGAMRLLHINKRLVGDIICADYVINSTLVAMWATYEDFAVDMELGKPVVQKDPEVFHVSSCLDSPVTWDEVRYHLVKAFADYPSKQMIWKHSLTMTACPIMFRIYVLYYHVIPAYIFDIFLRFTDTNLRMVPMTRKAHRFLVAISYFMQREWKFTNHNMRRVLTRMTKSDQDYFPSDIRRWKWSDFAYDYMHGLKYTVLSETPNSAAEGRKKYRKLLALHVIVLIFFYGIHAYLLYTILKFYGFFDYVENQATHILDFMTN